MTWTTSFNLWLWGHHTLRLRICYAFISLSFLLDHDQLIAQSYWLWSKLSHTFFQSIDVVFFWVAVTKWGVDGLWNINLSWHYNFRYLRLIYCLCSITLGCRSYPRKFSCLINGCLILICVLIWHLVRFIRWDSLCISCCRIIHGELKFLRNHWGHFKQLCIYSSMTTFYLSRYDFNHLLRDVLLRNLLMM